MNESLRERFYHLLPDLYRQLDLEQGEPLRVLTAVLESEFHTLEEDMLALYDNWFIQTCDDWAITYVADLLHMGKLGTSRDLPSNKRRLVANTIGYRRRKGTRSVVEHVIRDLTGWHVYMVEFFQYVATTQHLRHLRLEQGRTVNLTQTVPQRAVDRLFARIPHSVDVRSIHPAESEPDSTNIPGKYNLHNIGLYLWRLRTYPMRRSFACAVDKHGQGIQAAHNPHSIAPSWVSACVGRDMNRV